MDHENAHSHNYIHTSRFNMFSLSVGSVRVYCKQFGDLEFYGDSSFE